MTQVLDAILKKQLVTGPETVLGDYTSEMIDIDNREGEFAIQLVYDNGISVNMELSLEASNNGVDFSTVGESQQVITDSEGSHLWNVVALGLSYVSVKILVNNGSMDLQEILYVAKRRH